MNSNFIRGFEKTSSVKTKLKRMGKHGLRGGAVGTLAGLGMAVLSKKPKNIKEVLLSAAKSGVSWGAGSTILGLL